MLEHPFEVIDHTAEVGIVAYGRSLEELFANAAVGMMSFLIDPATVRPVAQRTIMVDADDRAELLIAWLNELLVLLNADGFIPGRFTVQELTDTRLRAEVGGEPVDPSRHRFRLDVKAATYHGLEIKRNDLWHARIIFDV
jgi:SHS2 domain-containing protein